MPFDGLFIYLSKVCIHGIVIPIINQITDLNCDDMLNPLKILEGTYSKVIFAPRNISLGIPSPAQ